MNPSDIYAVFQSWSVLFIIGLAFTPLTFLLFDRFFDKGYIFSKLIGLFLTGYTVFVFGVLHVVPFKAIPIWIIFCMLVVGITLLLPNKWKILYVIKRFWLVFVVEEILFLTILFVWAYIHSFAPDIHGLEKYMDFGFTNSFLRSEYFPPRDIWFTPFTINYYYFGHLLTAMLTKMTGLSSALSFNLMLTTIVAFCFTQTFSIGANLYYWLAKDNKFSKLKLAISGLLTACLVTFAGNLHIIYAFFKPYKADNPVPFWQLAWSSADFPNAYWYPNATRFIHNTIHEFPIYSWVVADLHGHVLDIPFVLLTIALLLSLVFSHTNKDPDQSPNQESKFQTHPLFLVFMGLLLACMYMTNAWDGAIYFILSALVLFYLYTTKIDYYKDHFGINEEESVKVVLRAKQSRFNMPERWKLILGRDYLFSILVVLTSFALFTVPYNLFFDPLAIVSGIGVLCAPDFLTGKIGPFLFEADHCQRSHWWELLILYGFFYFFVIIFAIRILRAKTHAITDMFVLLLIMLATFLIIIPEFFYIKDIYPAHYRANTMFKLVFQGFIMLGISSAYIIVKTFMTLEFSSLRRVQKIFAVGFITTTIVLVYLVMTYPYLAIQSYYGSFKTYHGLNGVRYLQTLYPADYDAIAWLNENVTGQPVVLEAQGDSYTDFARVSSNTGLPTVLGWTVHEWLWRGSYDIPSPRINEVKDMYENTDVKATKTLLDKYKVAYVFIGNLEYQKYPTLKEEKFKKLGKIVFSKGATKLYKIN